MAVKEYAEIVAICALSYLGNITTEYAGIGLSLEVQEALCGQESAQARAQRILDLGQEKPYAPERFLFAGIECGALEYLLEEN